MNSIRSLHFRAVKATPLAKLFFAGPLQRFAIEAEMSE